MVGRFYSPQLDGLRFVAALLVFIHHAPRVPYLSFVQAYGWVGVDLFLALSAYLITRLAILEHEATGQFSVRRFLIRRALRIWPLYFGFALACCLLSWLIGATDAWTSTKWALAHLSFSANILTAAQSYSPVIFSPHLWTIPLEEQAYLVLAFTITAYFARSGQPRVAVAASIGAIGLLTIARIALVDVPHPFVWVTLLRADPFILGALAAVCNLRTRWWPAGLILIAAIALFPPIGSGQAYDVFGYTVAAAGSVLLIVGAPKLLGVFRYLGKISYGIYVFHLAGIYAAMKLTSDPVIAFALGLGITLATSAASYHLYEAPFLRFKERFATVVSRPV